MQIKRKKSGKSAPNDKPNDQISKNRLVIFCVNFDRCQCQSTDCFALYICVLHSIPFTHSLTNVETSHERKMKLVEFDIYPCQ